MVVVMLVVMVVNKLPIHESVCKAGAGQAAIYGFPLAPPTHHPPPAAFEKNAKNPNNPCFEPNLPNLAELPGLAILSQIKRSDGLAGTKMEIR